jgi:ribosomal protein S11
MHKKTTMMFALACALAAASGCQKQASPPPTETTASPVAATEAAAPAEQRVVSILLMVDDAGVAVNGYDPVSYFSGAPSPGDPAIISIVDGAKYRFASVENKSAFDADPAAYQPQFGGYCAYGVAEGGKYHTDPATGTVVNGKLYFNKSKDVQRLWTENRDELIVKAEAVWPSIGYDAPKD